MLAAAAAAATAIVAALVLPMLGGPTGSKPAWAVERSEDGSVLVTVHEVDDPVRLQEDLRAAGVAAVVRAGSPSCGTWLEESGPELGAVLREDVARNGDDHFWRIDPRALRPGHLLALLITRVTPTGNPGGNEPVLVISYSFTIADTENPPCAPLPGPHSTSPVPEPHSTSPVPGPPSTSPVPEPPSTSPVPATS
jgi:hypothetical protein